MDNFHIDVTSEKNLLEVLRVGFRGSKATHFAKSGKTFVLFRTDHPQASALPVKMTADQCEPVVSAWLKDEADFGKEPDHDGSNGRGFRVSCDEWGHVKPYGMAAFLRIEPAWAMYGK